jgi:hypothetical protein
LVAIFFAIAFGYSLRILPISARADALTPDVSRAFGAGRGTGDRAERLSFLLSQTLKHLSGKLPRRRFRIGIRSPEPFAKREGGNRASLSMITGRYAAPHPKLDLEAESEHLFEAGQAGPRPTL